MKQTIALLCLAAPALGQDDVPSAPIATTIRLDVRTAPLIDLWFSLRADEEPPPYDAPGRELRSAAVRAIDVLEREVGSPLALGLVEGYLPGATDGAELVAAFAQLPEVRVMAGPRGNRRVELRRLATDAGRTLVAYEEVWRSEVWPAREAELARKVELLTLTFASERTHPALLHALSALGLRRTESDLLLPVYLTLDMPWPGAVTHRVPGGAASFVATSDAEGSLLPEIVLHEALHQVDAAFEGPSLLSSLREALAAAGARRNDQAALPHLLLFVAAADATRARIAPEHVDYGEARGVYDRSGPHAAEVLEAWRAHRAGELTRRQLVAEVVTIATGAPPR